MQKEKGFWIGLSLINLSVVAFFGLLMRSKILFTLPFLDYRNLLNAHAYLALCGWVGLSLCALLIYEVLPPSFSKKKMYTVLLWTLYAGALGMGLSFPFVGYHPLSVFFAGLFFIGALLFSFRFFLDLQKAGVLAVVRWLGQGAVASFLLSAVLPLALAYMTLSKSGNSLLYRDLSYTFLHLQYNGFFTLAIFAVFFAWCQKKGVSLPAAASKFSLLLLLSVLPSSFLALLWHNLSVFYALAAVGCLLILFSVAYFIPILRQAFRQRLFRHPLARVLWMAAFVSFVLKMILTTGTMDPGLGKAVYGARPIIIGFMHLVFLAFASFFILSYAIEQGYFSSRKGLVRLLFYVFAAGVLVTEALLMTQGLAVLLHWNNPFFNQGLWVGAILLFFGAAGLVGVFFGRKQNGNGII